MKKILLWIAVLPGSIAAYFLGYAFFKIMGYFSAKIGDPDDYSWITNITLPAFSSGLATYAFLLVGVFIAPNYKFYTLMILIILASGFFGISVFLLIIHFDRRAFFEDLGMLIGIIAGYIEINKKIQSGEKIDLLE